MENNARTYAHVLYQMTEEGKNTQEIARKFVQYMEAKGKTAVIPHVLNTYEHLRAQKELREKTHVHVAQPEDVKEFEEEIEKAVANVGGTGSTHTHTDPALIGGFIVRNKGKQIDTSYKRGLTSLYNKLIKHR